MDAVSLKREYDYQMNRSEFVSPEHSLRVSLSRTGKRNVAKSIYFAWPNVEHASRKLAGLLTHHFPNTDGRGFLMDEALAAACQEYEAAIETGSFTGRMSLYLRTLVDRAAAGILSWETHGILESGETLAWPVGGYPLQEWIKRKGVERVVFTKRSDVPKPEEVEASRIALSSMLLTFNDLVHVVRLKTEE